MILTDNDIVYWIDGNTIHASNTASTLELNMDFFYDHDFGYENYDLRLSPETTQLAYDKYSNRVYLFCEFFCVFDITDIDNPTAILIGGTHNGSFGLVTNAARCFCLSNGMIAVPGRTSMRDITFLFNPQTLSFREINDFSVMIVDDKGVTLSFSNKTMYIKDLLTGDISTVNVRGNGSGDINHSSYSTCAAPDGCCFWDNRDNNLCLIDLEGRLHIIAKKGRIKTKDFSPLPDNIWHMYVSNKYSCAIYDNSQKSILLMAPD